MNLPLSILSSAVDIRLLQSDPSHFIQVARWHHQESERQGLTSTLALRQQRLVLHLQQNPIPKTLIALVNNQLVGCVSLVNYTYNTSQPIPRTATLNPIWMTNLFSLESARQQGVGNSLIEAAKNYVYNLGVRELWLAATEFTCYYQKREWEIVRRTRLGGRHVNVMRAELKCAG